MRILITGANGYIGQRLIPTLLEAGHELVCSVRNRRRFEEEHQHPRLSVIEVDLLEEKSPSCFPENIDIAYYLVHSMSADSDFSGMETRSAEKFLHLLEPTNCQQVIYLSGIVNEKQLSRHLSSRLAVERILRGGRIPVTTLRAGIIVGSGSASFEIIRDLVEKLPVMVTPKWLNTSCQPIAIRNVIQFLAGVMNRPEFYNRDFDIGGPEILSYREMLLKFAEVRSLKRWIYTLPVMTPRLSSYWLYFITSTSYPLAVNLVDSMKIPIICRPNNLSKVLGITLLPYQESVSLAFQKIEQNLVLSSWKDAFVASSTPTDWMNRVEVPIFGCFIDKKVKEINGEIEPVMNNIWQIGGQQGWYYGNWLWRTRGVMDKMAGGVGLRRGRTNKLQIHSGDALDFWRVLIADKKEMRLLLYAEMKLPGEAWLEFRVINNDNKNYLQQTATFRPRGLGGRLYWYMMLPFHYFIFQGMANRIAKKSAW
ncbi:SDR family oxidoreductase [Flavihumibacter sp. ZG627]|uniref:SDR family oxidoreductase n=1 Tax=Flavihumibacter sp. ZG627 TaxID=1463156 RepID=UPI00057DF81E|nr:SDR family oxidoreductase [Flavihumibacter sp. ZG627]KIC91611.1 epimerase [Flavihumibacter sp. ZG627]